MKTAAETFDRFFSFPGAWTVQPPGEGFSEEEDEYVVWSAAFRALRAAAIATTLTFTMLGAGSWVQAAPHSFASTQTGQVALQPRVYHLTDDQAALLDELLETAKPTAVLRELLDD